VVPARWERVKDIFRSAVTLGPGERSAFLDTACGEDQDLRREVESLLNASSAASDAGFGAPVLGPAEPGPASHDLLGRRVGVYRVLAEIGEGGMGAVYRAVRDDDVFERHVALKVLRGGLASEFHRQSFHQERQILATLQHPNVAQLLDGGTTEDGRPYLVMELVAGERIDTYCESRALPLRPRLELFRQVCAAVQCAHQSLVVHRDLKPANILVTAEGVPKLLDFGIAKLLAPQGGDATVTQVRALTPPYASPEQLRGLPITTASDVYSLGVVLYELLTGRRPYELAGATPEELALRISQVEPVRPSAVSRVHPSAPRSAPRSLTVGPDAPTVEVKTSPPRIGPARELRGDLDTVVLTALAHDPQRRYPSAAALSEDLRRHLEGLPINARRPTLVYRAGKFVRRHPGGIAAAVLVAVSLVGGLAATTAQWRRAEAERVRAERQAERAAAVTRFLTDILGAAHPQTGLGRSATVVEALAAAQEQARAAFERTPDLQASVRSVVGQTYLALGQFDDAEPLLRAALVAQDGQVPPPLEMGETLRGLGELLMQKGQLEEAESLLRRALALEQARRGPRHVMVAYTLNSLGTLDWTRGDLDAATRAFRSAVAIVEEQDAPPQREFALLLGNLAAAVEAADPREAIGLYRRACDLWVALGQTRNPGYAAALGNLGLLLRDQGDLAGAERLLRESLALDREILGEEHPSFAGSLVNLAVVVRDRGDPAAARPLLLQALAILEPAVGREHWTVARARQGLGVCFLREGRRAEAERELRAAEAVLTKALGPQDERTQQAVRFLVELYASWDRPADAERYRSRLPAS
jgi:serine/threonine-protein kinase